METQWFPVSREVIKQYVGVCLLGQGWGVLVDHYVVLVDKLKQQLVSFKTRWPLHTTRSLLKGRGGHVAAQPK
jgi:hypothetical protein